MTKPTAITTCSDCQFFVSDGPLAGQGHCHHDHPMANINLAPGAVAVYPVVVGATDWCGLFLYGP